MTDNKPQPSHPPQPAPPKPPTDEQRVSEQVGVTDMTTTAGEALSGFFPFGGPVRFFGTTDFENHQLNDMIDLVAHANPEHLTSAGDALFRARDAIKKAAQELQANVRAVHWEGEAGNAFRAWGDKLAGHSQKLSDFADVAAVQISAAGSGLASVSKAMPQRDQRAQPVKVADIPPTKRVAGNAEYEAAVKVEKDRQEAINQMNRLSSFYSVSEQTLAAQQPPVFEPMPQVGVPQPLPGYGNEPREPVKPTTADRHSVQAPPAVRHPDERPVVQAHTDALGHALQSANETAPSVRLPTEQPVGTELTSVATPPAATAYPVQAPYVAPMGPTPAGGSGFLPAPGPFVSPIAGGSTRATGSMPGGFRSPAQQVSGSASTTGRGTTGPMGRAAAVEQGATRSGTSSTGQMPMGRGVSGGSPRAGGLGSPRAGSTGPLSSGRSGGIVGGRPNASSSASAASRTAKGTVVGAEGAPSAPATAGRAAQRGVVGAAGQRSVNGVRSFSNADGVTGQPQRRTAGARASRNGFSRGGSGLVRDTGSDGGEERGQDETDQSHRDQTECEGSPMPTQHGHVRPETN
ncbi:hypothetical protein [Streptomyces sp. NPDC001205]